jgi:hypothetical protein
MKGAANHSTSSECSPVSRRRSSKKVGSSKGFGQNPLNFNNKSVQTFKPAHTPTRTVPKSSADHIRRQSSFRSPSALTRPRVACDAGCRCGGVSGHADVIQCNQPSGIGGEGGIAGACRAEQRGHRLVVRLQAHPCLDMSWRALSDSYCSKNTTHYPFPQSLMRSFVEEQSTT